MDRKEVESSSIKSVGYERDTQTLEIEFDSGRVYQYYKVPENVYAALMRAESIGRYFNDAIRESYHFKQMAEKL